MSNSEARRALHASRVPLVKGAEATTTPASDSSPKVLKIDKKAVRRAQNEELLKNANVKAFLDTLAETEGGDYDFKFGAVRGRKNDKWRIKDYSLPPSPGIDGSTTASGRYQITKATWDDYAVKAMGLNDFAPHTQDLVAVETLRSMKATDSLVDGDIESAVGRASRRWQSLPQGPGKPNRPDKHGKPSKQPYSKYEDVVSMYKGYGGSVK